MLDEAIPIKQEGSITLASGFLESVPGDAVHRLQQLADVAPCAELERLAAMQNRASRRYFRLVEAHQELRARTGTAPRSTASVLADAMDAERKRLGRELHTGVGQSLAGIRVHVGILEAVIPDPSEPVRKSLDRIHTLTGTALEQVRGVSRGLYVAAWQAQPLAEALRNLWESSGISEKFAGTLDLRPPAAEPALEVRRALYLVAQEGISNAIQHANASHVRLSLREENDRLVLEVEDDGAGSAEGAQPAATTGIGLRSMRDLAHELGGELEARSGPQGARLTISFPVSHD